MCVCVCEREKGVTAMSGGENKWVSERESSTLRKLCVCAREKGRNGGIVFNRKTNQHTSSEDRTTDQEQNRTDKAERAGEEGRRSNFLALLPKWTTEEEEEERGGGGKEVIMWFNWAPWVRPDMHMEKKIGTYRKTWSCQISNWYHKVRRSFIQRAQIGTITPLPQRGTLGASMEITAHGIQ